MKDRWTEPDLRDEVVDFVNKWSEKTSVPVASMVSRLGLPRGKFYDWRERYGKANEHNGRVCRDFWLLEEEKRAIIAYAGQHPLEGYRRLCYMMIDVGVAAVSPASVYRVLKSAGLLSSQGGARTRAKGKGFCQPLAAHDHWHIDVSYINVSGTFYYLCSILDGYSRAIVEWTLGESMKEAEIELLIQRAKEAHPHATPRIISDNGPQFMARDFKELIRLLGMTHVRTAPYYPQSNGKIERFHGTIKSEAIRPRIPVSLEDARRIVSEYVAHYNGNRLHSAVGYVTPKDMLEGRRDQIHQARDAKLEAARQRRQAMRLKHLTLLMGEEQKTAQPEKQTRALEESNPPGISGSGKQPKESAQTADSPQTPRLAPQHA